MHCAVGRAIDLVVDMEQTPLGPEDTGHDEGAQ